MDDADLVHLRRALHAAPELSGHEVETARRIATRLDGLEPDELVTGLGGHGVAAVFEGDAPGRTVLLRAELDALPIQEGTGAEHASEVAGVAHLCGHDGHMAMLYGAARRLALRRPARGRFVALFQPAEETGEGGPAVAADPRFSALRPDLAFAVHNLPGEPLGSIVVRPGSMNCASRGLEVVLRGWTSHAAHPEDGRSPATAMCCLVEGLQDGRLVGDRRGFCAVTVVHARLGEQAFGTSPGEARVLVTLRAERDDDMEQLASASCELAASVAAAEGLKVETAWHDVFAATTNSEDAAALVREVASASGCVVRTPPAPIRWSEDFGALIARSGGGALIGLGSGEAQPQLHRPEYDFPDALIEPGVLFLERLARRAL